MCGGGSNDWNRNRSESDTSGSDRGSVPPEGEAEPQEVEGEDPCSVDEITDLDSTNSETLEDVSEGDIFPVEIRDGVPSVITGEDGVLGTITGNLGEILLECINSGYQYRAEIIKIDGMQCRVRVTRKCAIDTRATLASPNPDLLSEVSEGDHLSVEVKDDSLCIVDNQNRIIGSLAKPWTAILIECVQSGVEYEAKVTEVDGGLCEVEVQNKSSDK